MKTLTQICLYLFPIILFSQKYGGENYRKLFVPYSSKIMTNVVMQEVEGKPWYYKRNFLYSSYNIYFYPDSSYVFYFVSELDFQLSAGKYSIWNNIYELSWDSTLTRKIISSEEEYKKYFRFKAPTLLQTIDAAYFIEGKDLVPFKARLNKERIELLTKSIDLEKTNPQIDQYISIYFNASGDKLKINYNQNSKLEFSKDSIWGYIVTQNNQLKLYRLTPKGFNWYGTPGIQVVQTDYFIIYVIGDSRVYSYFSKDLDSKIYQLTIPNLESQFKDQPCFIHAVKKEFSHHKKLYALDDHIYSYRIVELYKACLEK